MSPFPFPLDWAYNRDPTIKAFKRRGFINHGSTLPSKLRIALIRAYQSLEQVELVSGLHESGAIL